MQPSEQEVIVNTEIIKIPLANKTTCCFKCRYTATDIFYLPNIRKRYNDLALAQRTLLQLLSYVKNSKGNSVINSNYALTSGKCGL